MEAARDIHEWSYARTAHVWTPEQGAARIQRAIDNARTCEEARAEEVTRLHALVLAERKRYTEAENALIDARASFLGLQPDTGGPVAVQMGAAIARINAILERHKLERLMLVHS